MPKGKVLIWIVAVIILIAILSVSGGLIYSNYYKNKPVLAKIEVSENQQNIEVEKGQEFTITFVSNASTGYSWFLDETYDKNVINYISTNYQEPSSVNPGAPGTELRTFKGVNKGTTTLNFSYARSWEQGSKPENAKVFNITVK